MGDIVNRISLLTFSVSCVCFMCPSTFVYTIVIPQDPSIYLFLGMDSASTSLLLRLASLICGF